MFLRAFFVVTLSGMLFLGEGYSEVTPKKAESPGILKKMTWKVGDEKREALVYIPPKLDKNAKPPLILGLITLIHPGGHEVPEGSPERIAQFFKEFPKK